MQGQRLYGSKPDRHDYERRCFEVAEYEARCVEYVFQLHGINASINERISVINRQFFGFAIDVHGGKRGRVQDVLGAHREIANAISQARGRRTPVRIQELPLMVEVRNPWPMALDYQQAQPLVGAHRMLAGVEYDPYAGRQQLVFDFADVHHHILIAGASGAGKSVLQNMMVLSLAASTSPAELRMVLIDLKGQDLPKYAKLPHVAEVVTKIDAAEAMIAAVRAEVEWRKEHYRPSLPRLVTVIDELAELRDSKDALNDLKSILALGRGLGVNCVLCTQDPTKDTLGEKLTRNISVKLVGSVEKAEAAAIATGRPNTGAHLLPLNSGAFVAVAGSEVRRFQAFYLPVEPVVEKVADVAEEWAERLGGRPLPPAFHSKAQPVMRHHQPAALPVTVRQTRYEPDTSPIWGDMVSDISPDTVAEPVFGADLGRNPTAHKGDISDTFPIGRFRPLTPEECAAVRQLATLDEYRYAGKPALGPLAIKVYGSRNPERTAEIDRALAGDVDESKIIRLPQRAAQR